MVEPQSAGEGTWRRDRFIISTDPKKADHETITGFLATSYWAGHLTRDQIIRSLQTSLIYSLFDEHEDRQIGFTRVVSDHVRFAYLSDVFVLEAYQGQGLGAWLIDTVMSDPRLDHVEHWVLATSDAQAFYKKLGFDEAAPGRYMVMKR